ncbi:hypothetical protein H5410_015001 [Solanum commersonii]|uniref:Uncharacterized protein n=1 Tax=Solanum commersonii TaxID=4109 RepID=A0A9J5ZSJ1_SOLCO|nr:hypothetical protein H5410_015001 [Solanum commersonii]
MKCIADHANNKGHQPVIKPFKFLSFWVEDISLNEVVLQHWKTNESGYSFWIFKHKLKNLKKALRVWSREREEIMKMKEQLFEEDPSFSNRMAIQQAGITWFEKGDRNTRFFRSLVKGRRKKLQIHRIKNTSEFAQKSCKYFAIGSGVEGPFVQCHQTIQKWWNIESPSSIKPIL